MLAAYNAVAYEVSTGRVAGTQSARIKHEAIEDQSILTHIHNYHINIGCGYRISDA